MKNHTKKSVAFFLVCFFISVQAFSQEKEVFDNLAVVFPKQLVSTKVYRMIAQASVAAGGYDPESGGKAFDFLSNLTTGSAGGMPEPLELTIDDKYLYFRCGDPVIRYFTDGSEAFKVPLTNVVKVVVKPYHLIRGKCLDIVTKKKVFTIFCGQKNFYNPFSFNNEEIENAINKRLVKLKVTKNKFKKRKRRHSSRWR